MASDWEYRLIYWPDLPGRGEFVRLILEAAQVPYLDVARRDGIDALFQALEGGQSGLRPLAPPILRHGQRTLAQLGHIALYLARRHALVPDDEEAQLAANQLYLTLVDCLDEVHNAHHPLGKKFYFEEQREAAKQATRAFLAERLPFYLHYFEDVLAANSRGHLVGDRLSYVDLGIFQLLAGLRYGFPNAMERQTTSIPGLVALAHRVDNHPPIAAYLASPRRIPFNEMGIFRHYPELDGP
ncbi:MAG: glutathione S-transferase [Candidatus Competibacterales bacterium]